MEEKKPITTVSLFTQDSTKKKFEEMLGKRAPQFLTSILQIVSQDDKLRNADPTSIYNAAIVAATLDLPINNNLGFAYIIPYNEKQSNGQYKQVAQFQLGYKGFKQLALRSGQFLNLSSTDVREGEIKAHNRLTGEMIFDWIEDYSVRESKKIVGYVSFFKLINGFNSVLYMTIEQLTAHGKKYSQTFKKDYGKWKDDFEAMCLKTVTKLNLSRNAPLSIEMQKAVITDQAVINNEDGTSVTYADHEIIEDDPKSIVENCKTLSELFLLQNNRPDIDIKLFNDRKEELLHPINDKKESMKSGQRKIDMP